LTATSRSASSTSSIIDIDAAVGPAATLATVRKIITTLFVVFTITAVAEARFHGATHSPSTTEPSVSTPPTQIGPPGSTAAPSIPAGALPNASITPGAIATTDTYFVCHRSTRAIRPPASYTDALKREQIAQYGFADTSLADYEEDHLVPLELGGDPRDPRNLWPESRLTYPGAAQKDKVEHALHERVCFGGLALTVAQHEIATNWYAVWMRIGRP
jgi:hypothetical protein